MAVELRILVASLFISLITAAIGAVFAYPDFALHYELLKPIFNLTDGFFGVFWAITHILLGLSLYLIWTSDGRSESRLSQCKAALSLFGLLLASNLLWPFFFFGIHSVFFGLVSAIVMSAITVFSILRFDRLSRTAALLVIPYLLLMLTIALMSFVVWQSDPTHYLPL